MPPTIRDVAQKAGVGLGTVSRVLNKSGFVAGDTRERVMRAIADLRYEPSMTARRLSLGKTSTIAVIAPFFTRPAFVERLRGIESLTADSDYDLVIYNVETSAKRDLYFRTVPNPQRADGVIIISLPPRDEDVRLLAGSTVPVVLVDANGPSLSSLNRIVIDDVEGGRIATEHLIALGHRRIGYLGDVPDSGFMFTASHDRHAGYAAAMDAAGLPRNPDHDRAGIFGRTVARDLALAMLSLPEPPTAIFATSDTQAMGVLEAARSLGLDVPGDLSVIGYDDIEIAEYLGLSTVRQPLFESGKTSVELLLGIVAEPHRAPVRQTMPVELVARATTAAPR